MIAYNNDKVDRSGWPIMHGRRDMPNWPTPDELADALDAANAKLAAAERAYREEHDIVARIWVQLGSPSYESLNGRSIHDLVAAALAATPR